MQVSVRELKTNLSKYLRLIKAGGAIIVTSHRIPLARLVPVPQVETGGALRRLAQSEEITWNGKKPRGGRLRPGIRGRTAAERVLEDRG